MQRTCTFTIDCSDCYAEKKYGKFANREHVCRQGLWVLELSCFFGHPLENDKVGEGKHRTRNQHVKSKENILRVVACSLGDSCSREWFLLVVFDCHVVAVEGD